MEGNGQLARAEVGPEVPADLADGVDEQLPEFLRDRLRLGIGQPVEVLRPVERLEERNVWRVRM